MLIVSRLSFYALLLMVYPCVASVGQGLLIGVVFHNTNIQQLSASNNFTSMAVGFTTIQSSLKLFGNERVVFWREASAGSSRTAYFLGKNLCDLPRLLLVPAFYLALFLGFSGVHDHNKVRYWALFMGVWATSGIGYMASTLFSRTARRSLLDIGLLPSVRVFPHLAGVRHDLADIHSMFICEVAERGAMDHG